MATRSGWIVALAIVSAGCHSGARGQRLPVSMVAPATIDEKKPSAAAMPTSRGVSGESLSTAAGPGKRPSGEEESTIEFPTAPPPEVVPPAAKSEETPTPVPVPPNLVPPPTSPAPTPIAPQVAPPSATPPAAVPAMPPAVSSPTPGPTLAPPVPVETPPVAPNPAPAAPSPKVPAKTVSTESNRQPAPLIVQKSTSTAPVGDLAQQLRMIYEKAADRYAGMDSYNLRMRRREVVGSKARPEELIMAKFRREPFSIYLKWVGEEGKGREVAYVKGQYEDMVHTLMAPGDLFLFAGKHFKVAPDSPLVKSNCRYPITEAGLGPLIARFGRLATAVEKGESQEGSAKYLGRVKRPEFDEPVEEVVQTLPAKYEGLFPAGGERRWFFDTTSGLPVLIITTDDKGREVEYYCHDRIQAPVRLDNDDFNPYVLWKAAKK